MNTTDELKRKEIEEPEKRAFWRGDHCTYQRNEVREEEKKPHGAG